MSLLHRFRAQTESLSSGSADEHEAVVELLALAAFADHRITEAELAELDAFDVDHASWDEAAFSVLQHLPLAIAAARSGSTSPEDLAARISTPALRAEALDAVAGLLAVDRSSAEKSEFLTHARRALA